MKEHPSIRRVALAAALALVMAGCSIPAKLERPALRDDVPLAGLQTATRAGWPEAAWWRRYQDPQLDQLIDMALKGSPDLVQAKSRVDSAQQTIRVAAAQAGLRIDGSAQVARQRLSDHGLIPSQFLGFSWYNQADLGVQLQYDFDWWGKKRHAIESAVDQAHAAEAQRSAASLALQSSVADTYFGWLADRQRVKLADDMIAAQERLLRIAELRVRQGVDLSDTAEQARSDLAAARQQRVALDGSSSIRLAALAALVGVSPAGLPKLEPRALPDVELGLPTNANIDLIARRPDIAASRWQVEAALKQTDVARAQFYPDVSIGATAGLSSIDLDKLFTGGSRVFGLTPALHLPIFEGGALEANYGVSKAQLDTAIAQYNSTVIAAARDVATQSLGADEIAGRRTEQAKQVVSGEKLLGTAEARAKSGVRDGRESLMTRAQLLQQRDTSLSLHAQALSADVALVKSLGGGYRAEPVTTVSSTSSSTSANSTGALDHERQ
ncbi:MAG TPA: efflux transporter outer membrane subunit [Luteibacter sp.]|jgi:NodT family efflux transporter outer membrane factor (OMF) lipoprotein|nr:efflux transporter outer membrane subunit [Luteibacter sp.]